jgi:voltage-gated potassium channel
VTGTGAPPTRLTTRRELAVVLGRALFNVVALVVLYFVLPLNRPFGWSTVTVLVVGVVGVGALVAWQVRSIMNAKHPVLRGIETTALTITLFLTLFAIAYVTLSGSAPESFSEPLSRIDGLYFVMTVFATVGFGDITPVTDAARVLTLLQMVSNLLFVGLVLRVILTAVRRGSERVLAAQRGAAPSPSGPDGHPSPGSPSAALPSSPPRDEAAGNAPAPRSSS